MSDEVITKRRVTMRSVVALPDGGTAEHKAIDYVRPDFLDAYVADARTRWQSVEVSDEPDAGPAGYHGATHVPANLNHPLAGQTFPATTPEGE
ncbi:hypothetical protein HII28_02240 [Planctomonas sp. JC2975]|uniref:hypothetical protein n=1 Tax=Planctomonas sp. JC2975 TaxID=2729626 RepID=UPI001472F2E3|nr:hypothetical protein [Planctomonas sp. JC2975]NNC10707.1 hypothetical protein [Planctomonas sp. JC2975]